VGNAIQTWKKAQGKEGGGGVWGSSRAGWWRAGEGVVLTGEAWWGWQRGAKVGMPARRGRRCQCSVLPRWDAVCEGSRNPPGLARHQYAVAGRSLNEGAANQLPRAAG